MINFISNIKDFFKISPLITNVHHISDDHLIKERKYIGFYRGYQIDCFPGEYEEDHYSCGLVCGTPYVSGSTQYGEGIYVTGDRFIVWVKTQGETKESIKRGVDKAVIQVKAKIDWGIDFREKLNHKDDAMKQSMNW